MTTEEATIDQQAAQERVQAILKPNGGVTLAGVSSQAPAHPPAQRIGISNKEMDAIIAQGKPAPNRKPRSDKGSKKRPPADPDEITLKLTLDDARQAAFQLSDSELTSHIATKVQDQIIGQLQKRLDLLTKQK